MLIPKDHKVNPFKTNSVKSSGRSLQSGNSHFPGQFFSDVCGRSLQDSRDGRVYTATN